GEYVFTFIQTEWRKQTVYSYTTWRACLGQYQARTGMSSTPPLVSIITVNYNSIEHTLEFLASVEKLTYPNLEVIVVDNASAVDPKEAISGLFPKVVYLRSDRNLGFAGGNNLGFSVSTGDYIFYLNNDTIVFPDFLEGIIEFM